MIHYRNFHSEMEHGDEDWLDPVKASRELMDSDDKYNRILSRKCEGKHKGKTFKQQHDDCRFIRLIQNNIYNASESAADGFKLCGS